MPHENDQRNVSTEKMYGAYLEVGNSYGNGDPRSGKNEERERNTKPVRYRWINYDIASDEWDIAQLPRSLKGDNEKYPIKI